MSRYGTWWRSASARSCTASRPVVVVLVTALLQFTPDAPITVKQFHLAQVCHGPVKVPPVLVGVLLYAEQSRIDHGDKLAVRVGGAIAGHGLIRKRAEGE